MIGQILVVQRRPKRIRNRLNRCHYLCVSFYSLTRPWFDFSFSVFSRAAGVNLVMVFTHKPVVRRVRFDRPLTLLEPTMS